jgi:uncharacterized membrane protein
MHRGIYITLSLIGILLVLSGIYTLRATASGAAEGHLASRVEQATEPIIREALRTPKYVEEFGQREKEFKSLVDTVYGFAEEANGRAFLLTVKIVPVGILQIVVGITLLVIGFIRPKAEPKK